MIIVRIQGGLGNQMFQYAYAKALNVNNNEVKLDISNSLISFSLDEYNTNLDVASDEEIKKFFSKNKLLNVVHKIKGHLLKEKSLSFDENLLNTNDNKYIYGYFQSEKYFLNIKDTILKHFIIKKNISSYTKTMQNKIKQCKTTCSIHIRRGDYIKNKSANKIHGTCSLDYYKNAISIINKKCKNVTYFIFSDEIDWVKDNLIIENAIYINNDNRRPHEDILLMSLCDHNIIANSSFSWWASWMNKNENKIIIAPKRWYRDEFKNKQAQSITCCNWVRI